MVFQPQGLEDQGYNLPIDSRCTSWLLVSTPWPISILTSTSPWIKQLETSWNIYKYYAHIMFAQLSNDCWTWPSFTTQKIHKKTINNTYIYNIETSRIISFKTLHHLSNNQGLAMTFASPRTCTKRFETVWRRLEAWNHQEEHPTKRRKNVEKQRWRNNSGKWGSSILSQVEMK